MLKFSFFAGLLLVLYAPAASAQAEEIEVPGGIFTKLEIADSLNGNRDWQVRDAKRVMATVNLDKTIDDIERETINLILGNDPFIAATVRNGEKITRTIEANLSSDAVQIFAEAIGQEVDVTDAYFGPEQTEFDLLTFREEDPIWPKPYSDEPEPYSDITSMSAAYQGLRWMTGRFGLNPSNNAGAFVFASDTPALEGDLASILAELSEIDLYEWRAVCEIQGQELDRTSKRALTHLAVETCLQGAFDNSGYNFEGEPLTRALMLEQIRTAYEKAATNSNWPLKQRYPAED